MGVDRNNSITANQIRNDTLTESELSTTNEPSDGQILSYDSASGNFSWVNEGAATAFLSLTDTPSSFTGNAGQSVRVNSGETALEFSYPIALWDADTNTGIQVEETSNENKIRFDISGTEKAVWDSTGLGVGTATPADILHIYDTTDSAIRLQRAGQSNYGTWEYNSSFMQLGTISQDDFKIVTDNTSRIYIQSTGSIGINTINSTKTLEIANNGASNNEVLINQFNNGANASYLVLQKSDNDTVDTLSETVSGRTLGVINFKGVNSSSSWALGAFIGAIQDGSVGATYVPTNLILKSYSSTGDNTNQLVLHNDGNIGVKTDTPLAPLHIVKDALVYSGVEILRLDSVQSGAGSIETGSGSRMLFTVPYSGNISKKGAAIEGVKTDNADDNSSTALKFYVSQNDESLDLAMTIDENKNVRIRGTCSFDKLDTNTLIVSPSSSYTTISLAMTAAVAGDTILVAEGTYTETVTFSQDNITLKAIGSKSNTIITQSADTVVDFSIKSGCIIDGFTINVTAADAATDYCIAGSNDSVSEYDYIINCDINWTSSSALNAHTAIYVTDGNYEMRNCNVIVDSNYTSTLSSGSYCIRQLTGANHDFKVINCKLVIDNEGTGATASYAIRTDVAGILTVQDTKIEVSVEHSGAGRGVGILNATSGRTVNLYNNHFVVDCNGTGLANGIKPNITGTIINSYHNIYDISNSDLDSTWAEIVSGSTVNSYGDHIIDGTLSNSGIFNPYGIITAGDNGYACVSDGDTGGSGSAGSGNQYIEVEINGTIYKVLHDGTV